MIRLGQHFLKNKNTLKKIARLLDLNGSTNSPQEKADMIVEIGPGHGELTEEIRDQRQETRIIAIEKDENLVEELQGKFFRSKKIKIIHGDALQILKKSSLRSPVAGLWSLISGRYKLVGNIPYYITGKLLRMIGELPKKPEISILTMQKEVAERLTAKPPRANRLSASVQFWAEVKIAFFIPRNDFFPKPEVDSATVILKTINRKISAKRYYAVVRTVFSQPRKTILNNVSDGMGISKEKTRIALEKIGIDPNLRPQNLSVEDIIKIASTL